MSTYSVNETAEEEKIDLMGGLSKFLDAFKRTWLIVVICAAVCAGGLYLKDKSSYVPMYRAETTVSVVTEGASSSNNISSAAMIKKVFPYIMSDGMLKKKVAAALGTSNVPATVTMQNIEGTNLLTIISSSTNAEDAYNVLQAVIANYDEFTRYVVGTTTMEIYSESGIPTQVSNSFSSVNSLIKGGMIGAMIGLLYTLFYMMVFRTISDDKDLQSTVNVRYLGTLPVYKIKKRRKGTARINIMNRNVQQDYLEAMRLVRTRVMNSMRKHNEQVLMVTSSIPGEGKSTVACNLAIALAKEGKSVLLIDCDLRNPSVQSTMGFKGEFPGVSAILRGEVTTGEASVSYTSKHLNLIVIPGNATPTSHTEILRSKKMKELLDLYRDKVEYIILDTPPAGLLADSMYAADYADSVLYVVMCDYTRTNVIRKSVQEITENGLRFVGCVLNGGKKASSTSGYGYGYSAKKYSGYANAGSDEEE